MLRAELQNGVTAWYDPGPEGSLIMEYPDGSQVQTTWAQLRLIEKLIKCLRDVYEELLANAGRDGEAPTAMDTLFKMDELLFALNGWGERRRSRSSDTCSQLVRRQTRLLLPLGPLGQEELPQQIGAVGSHDAPVNR